ncbi:hypothetical protein B0H14DRAFT_2593454 [Mycena olivaceomarginata]|nr:hypothetical protein B0H14DRAFT_2593454 [Mycena olivaceomarginata]
MGSKFADPTTRIEASGFINLLLFCAVRIPVTMVTADFRPADREIWLLRFRSMRGGHFQPRSFNPPNLFQCGWTQRFGPTAVSAWSWNFTGLNVEDLILQTVLYFYALIGQSYLFIQSSDAGLCSRNFGQQLTVNRQLEPSAQKQCNRSIVPVSPLLGPFISWLGVIVMSTKWAAMVHCQLTEKRFRKDTNGVRESNPGQGRTHLNTLRKGQDLDHVRVLEITASDVRLEAGSSFWPLDGEILEPARESGGKVYEKWDASMGIEGFEPSPSTN